MKGDEDDDDGGACAAVSQFCMHVHFFMNVPFASKVVLHSFNHVFCSCVSNVANLFKLKL